MRSFYKPWRGIVKLPANKYTQKLMRFNQRQPSEVLPAYEKDDGPISDEYLTVLREDAKAFAPKGHLIKKTSLF